jgi:hypothetical protein
VENWEKDPLNQTLTHHEKRPKVKESQDELAQ